MKQDVFLGWGLRWLVLLLMLPASCGGGGDSSGIVASGGMASVEVRIPLARSVASLETGGALAESGNKVLAGNDLLNLLIPEAMAAFTPTGISSVSISITGAAITAKNAVFNVSPGQQVSRTFDLPIGNSFALTVQAFSGALGAGTRVYQATGTIDLATATAGKTLTVPVAMVPLINLPSLPTAPAITTTTGVLASSQIVPNDPNTADTHSYAITVAPANGTASVSAAGLIDYTPNATFTGSDSITVTVTDQGGLTGTVTIPVTVNATQTAIVNTLTDTPAGLVPSSVVIGSTGNAPLVLLINGLFFTPGSSVTISQGGTAVALTGVTQTFVSGQQISLAFPAGFFPAGNLNALQVTLTNNIGTSNAVTLTRVSSDAVAPTVINHLPQNGATNVDSNSNIQVFFSELINQATVTSSSFSLTQGGSPVAGSLSFIQTPGDQTIAIFNPSNTLTLGTVYTATLGTGIKDLSGNAMATSASFSFTTATAAIGDPSASGNLGFELGTFAGYSLNGGGSVTTQAGTGTPWMPTEGSKMARITSGTGAVSNASSTLASGTMTVPTSSVALLVDVNFLSAEYPSYVDSQFNDTAQLTVNTASGSNVFTLASVKDAPFVTDPASSISASSGTTGFFTRLVDLSGLQGTSINVQYDVSDVGDTSVNSDLLIDNIRFVSQGIGIAPQLQKLAVNVQQQFSATLFGLTGSVSWSVDGIAGGNATVGTITNTGLYTAPASVPAGNDGKLVRIKATSTTNPTLSNEAIVKIGGL